MPRPTPQDPTDVEHVRGRCRPSTRWDGRSAPTLFLPIPVDVLEKHVHSVDPGGQPLVASIMGISFFFGGRRPGRLGPQHALTALCPPTPPIKQGATAASIAHQGDPGPACVVIDPGPVPGSGS
jgi:hypothetical protein